MPKDIKWNPASSAGTGVSSVGALNGMADVYSKLFGNIKTPEILAEMGKRRSDNENQDAVAAIMGADPKNRAGVRDNIIAGLSKGANPLTVMADSNQLLQQRFQTENQGRKLDAELRSSNAYSRNVDHTISKENKKLSDDQKMDEIMVRSRDPETGEPVLKLVMKHARDAGIDPENVGPGIKRANQNSGLTARRTAAEQLRTEGVERRLRGISPSGNTGSSGDVKSRVNFRNFITGGGMGKAAAGRWQVEQEKVYPASIVKKAMKAGLVQPMTGGLEYDKQMMEDALIELSDIYNKRNSQ